MLTPSILPQGQNAALLRNVSYSIPGLFLFSELVYEALEQVRAKFDYQIPVQYLYGSPQVRWNGGRLIFRNYRYARDAMEKELSGAVEHGMTPLLTFSTTAMDEELLKDPDGNLLLEMLNDLHGGAIVTHPLLKGYIEKHFPNIELHASVLMTVYPEKRDESYYRSLAKEYRRFVVNTDDNHDLELMARIPKERAEVILNERCGYHCPQRREHYESIGVQQPAIIEGCTQFENFLGRCPYVPEGKQSETKARHISLTTQEAAVLADMGFDLFKLQGRLDSPYVFFFDFFRYTLEPELAFPTMYPIFSYSIRRFLKEREKKHRG